MGSSGDLVDVRRVETLRRGVSKLIFIETFAVAVVVVDVVAVRIVVFPVVLLGLVRPLLVHFIVELDVVLEVSPPVVILLLGGRNPCGLVRT